MEFVTPQKKLRKIIHNNYVYIFQKDLANQIRSFEFQLRRKVHCRAKIKVDDGDNIVGHTNEHIHASSQTNNEVVCIKSSIKDRAEETRDSPQQILPAALSKASASVNLPKLEYLRRAIRSQRKNDEHPANPINMADIPNLPIEYQ